MTLRLCDYKIVNTWHGSTRKKKTRTEMKKRQDKLFFHPRHSTKLFQKYQQ